MIKLIATDMDGTLLDGRHRISSENIAAIRQAQAAGIRFVIATGRIMADVRAFIESYDLTGKTVIPFNTHEGSGQSGTQRVIENALPGSTVLQGLAIQGKVTQEDP